MSGQMFRLMLRHQRFDEMVRREQRRRNPDMFKLIRLKKLKLRAKDMLFRLMAAPRRAG